MKQKNGRNALTTIVQELLEPNKKGVKPAQRSSNNETILTISFTFKYISLIEIVILLNNFFKYTSIGQKFKKKTIR